jgi:protoporphyrinogen oxidase
MHVVVLGAGLAGLAAGLELVRAGHRVTLLERELQVGGMAASWRHGPYWLDYGPHRFHTRDPELEAHVTEVLDGEVVRRERLSRIHLRGRFFRYPLEVRDVLSGLDRRLLAAALRDYALTRARRLVRPLPDTHFENWVSERFGRTLYELFFEPYTSKAWGLPCTEISADWAAQRISQASLLDTIRHTLFPPRDGAVRSLVGEFLYPRRGGIGQLARKYAEKIRAGGGAIRLGSTVRALERDGDTVRRVHHEVLGEREVLEADWVLNTAPVNRVLPLVTPDLGAGAGAAAQRLEHVAIVFVYLEVRRPRVSPDHWIYLPERHLTIHRVSEFKNFSDDAAPGDRTVLCCEITCRAGDRVWRMELEEAGRAAIADLERCGLLRPGEARALDLQRLPNAYPVYRVGYREPVAALFEASRRLDNLTHAGRQGLFRYNNMDHSIAMGRHAASQVGLDAPREFVLPGEPFG